VTKLIRITPDGTANPINVRTSDWVNGSGNSALTLEIVREWIGGRVGVTTCRFDGKNCPMIIVEDALNFPGKHAINPKATALRLDYTTSLGRQRIPDFDALLAARDPEIMDLVECDRRMNTIYGTVLVETGSETWTKITVRHRGLGEVMDPLGAFEPQIHNLAFTDSPSRPFVVGTSTAVQICTGSDSAATAVWMAVR